MPDHLTELATEYRTVAAAYSLSADRLRLGMQSANTPFLKKHQQDAIDKAEGRAATLLQQAADIEALMAELSWWRTTYPNVQPKGA